MAEGGSAATYRAIKDGNWSDVTTWEASTDGGTTWSSATGYPGDTSDIQDTISSLQGYTVTYDLTSMAGSVDMQNTDGSVVLPDGDPGADITFNAKNIRYLNFDLSSKGWERNITINVDGGNIQYSTIRDDEPLLVLKITDDISDTEKKVKLFDLYTKDFIQADGSELQAGQTVWYDYSNSDTISGVSFNAANNEFTITLSNGITTFGAGDFLAVETQKIKIISQNFGGMSYYKSKFYRVFLKFTGNGNINSSQGYIRQYGYFKDSVILITARGPFVIGCGNYVCTNGTGLGSEYGGFMLRNSFYNFGTGSYNIHLFKDCIGRQMSYPDANQYYDGLEFVTPQSFGLNGAHKDKIKFHRRIKDISSFSFWLNTTYWVENPMRACEMEINGVVCDYIFFKDGGYLYRERPNTYFLAVGDAEYYNGGYMQNGGMLCFEYEGSGSGKYEIYKNGSLVASGELTYTIAKQRKCVNISSNGDYIEIYIEVPDGGKIYADSLENIFQGGGVSKKGRCC